MPLNIGSRLGPYELVARIGAGGMGEVYRARDTRLGRDVAIKILPPAPAENPVRRARFTREAQAISRLSHPNICTIYDVGEDCGIPFLVMELVDGESLEARLRLGALPPSEALQIAIQIAAAADSAHSRGIIHRDLKPSNVMLSESGVKLLDFGIAKLLDQDDDGGSTNALVSTETLTAEHKVVGTLNYMAPEQLEGRGVDERTDVFALGAVTYEMLAGRKAFDGTSSASVTAAVLTAQPPSLAGDGAHKPVVPPALDHVLRRALAKNPDERWQTARDLRHELRWILDDVSPALGRPSTGGQRFGRPAVLAIGAVTLVAATLVILWWLRRPTILPRPTSPTVFTIEAPEGTHFGPNYGQLAVSPDGLKIAFLATQDEKTSIWLRKLDSLLSSRLRNTEGAIGPFWSPDSQSIGFVRGSKLMWVDVAGSEAHLVTDLGSRADGSACWLPDDTIVLSKMSETPGLFRVPAKGGKLVPFATIDTSKNELSFTVPALVAPDRVLYLVRRNFRQFSESRIKAIGFNAPSTSLDVQSNAVYASGYLVFRQGSTLVAQPFDRHALRLTGQPLQLAADVDYNPASARTVFSASDDLLAYRATSPRRLTWVDRKGHPLGSIGERTEWDPIVTADGKRVAFDRYDPIRSAFQVWTIDETGTESEISHGAFARFPASSGNGDWIAYQTFTSDGRVEVHRVRATGGNDEILLRRELQYLLDWSRDGRYLVYQADGNVWAAPVGESGAEAIQLTSTPGPGRRAARISPDGRWVAYTAEDAGKHTLWLQAFPGGSTPTRVSTDYALDPSWRADGRELYYITLSGTVMAVPVTNHTPPTLGAPVALFATEPGAIRAQLHVFSPAADGQRFLVSEPVQGGAPITVILHWPALIKQ